MWFHLIRPCHMPNLYFLSAIFAAFLLPAYVPYRSWAVQMLMDGWPWANELVENPDPNGRRRAAFNSHRKGAHAHTYWENRNIMIWNTNICGAPATHSLIQRPTHLGVQDSPLPMSEMFFFLTHLGFPATSEVKELFYSKAPHKKSHNHSNTLMYETTRSCMKRHSRVNNSLWSVCSSINWRL